MSLQLDARTLAEVAQAQLIAEGTKITERFVTDSRKVEPGVCYVAVVGERVDGNDFALSAMQAGASAVILTRPATEEELAYARESGAGLVLAQAGDTALLNVAGWWRRNHPDWTVVAVTGSNGKTTTKEMCAGVLAGTYRVYKTEANYNSTFGMPLTLLAAPEDAQVIVLEMGMNGVGEIEAMARAAAPQFAVITSVGTAHIGLLGSRENIARAKAELVEHITADYGALQPKGDTRLVLSGEDDFADFIEREFAKPASVGVLRAGWREGDSLRGTELVLDELGCAHFEVNSSAATWEQSLAITGKHAATDALFAAAVGLAFGVDPADIAARLAALKAGHMRQELLVRADGLRIIDDSYNASPESMAGTLQVLANMECSGQRVAVLGEMGEQGDAARDLHRLVGAYAAAIAPDLLVIIGHELADEMASAALTMGLDVGCLARYETVDEALAALCPVLGADDLVCVKASRASGLDQFSQGVYTYVR